MYGGDESNVALTKFQLVGDTMVEISYDVYANEAVAFDAVQRPAPDDDNSTCYAVVTAPEGSGLSRNGAYEQFTSTVHALVWCNFKTSVSYQVQLNHTTNGTSGIQPGQNVTCSFTDPQGGHCPTASNTRDRSTWPYATYTRDLPCHNTYQFTDYGSVTGTWHLQGQNVPLRASGPTTQGSSSNYC
jgi:hypothetical protein